MPSQAVLGVDPGVRGALALLRSDGSVAGVWGLQPQHSESEVVEAVRHAARALRLERGNLCFFEKVQHMSGDGAKGSHTFGNIKGLLKGALLMARVEVSHVYPMIWQGGMGCLSKGNKNVTKTRAIEVFPGEKITHGVADALLIARYGWERTRGLARPK